MWLEFKAVRQNGEVKKGVKINKITTYFVKSTSTLDPNGNL